MKKHGMPYPTFLIFSFLLLFLSCNTKIKPTADNCIDSSKIREDAVCPMLYQPVCGCDGETYSNDCVASNAGVKTWTAGTCPEGTTIKEPCIDPTKINPQGACVKIYKPVCGCDENTYNNSCEAEKKGVLNWVEGKCPPKAQEGCIDPSKGDDRVCFEVYKPVCGCDGETYSNACYAERVGVLKWKEGACP